jgi:hypothetical protein
LLADGQEIDEANFTDAQLDTLLANAIQQKQTKKAKKT